MLGAPELHVGLRGAGAAACTELSVQAPGGDRRQGRTGSEPTVLELRMANQIALKSQKQKYIIYSLKPQMLYNLKTEWIRLCRIRNFDFFFPFINSFPPWWLVGQSDFNPFSQFLLSSIELEQMLVVISPSIKLNFNKHVSRMQNQLLFCDKIS